jgi:hypothetical protein
VSGDLFNEIGTYKMPAFRSGLPARHDAHAVARRVGHPEAIQRENLRVNLNAALSPKFDLTVNTGFSKTDQRAPNVDNNVTGIGGLILPHVRHESLQP